MTARQRKDLKTRWRDFRRSIAPRMREFQKSLWMIRGSPLSMVGLIIILGLIFAAIFAPIITPYGAEERIWTDIKDAPSGDHWFGTDDSGGDVFSRIIWGSQISLKIGILVVVTAGVLGSTLGVVAAYFGKWVDEIIMRITDIFIAFPGLILAMAVASALGRSIENVMLALVVVWWPAYARLVRSVALSVREQKYIESARAVGAGNRRIVFRHMLPNCMSPMLVQGTMDMGAVMLVAAGLSFIGFGAQPGQAEWGRMVADGQAYFITYPWISFFPGMAIFLTVLGFNLFGDGLRDIMDPKLRSLVRRRF